MARDDFPEGVKLQLAKRVGFKCTVCGCETSGPSSDPKRSVSIGIAAHITAAAPGGPRYDNAMTPEERSSITNGIWACENHGKLIDADPDSFTGKDLHERKAVAEAEQTLRLLGRSDSLKQERERKASFEGVSLTLGGDTRYFVWDGALPTLPEWPARSLEADWCDALDRTMQLATAPQKLALSWCTEDRPQFRSIYETDAELKWKRRLRGDPRRNAEHRFCLFAVEAPAHAMHASHDPQSDAG
jgi:hypothetical protein